MVSEHEFAAQQNGGNLSEDAKRQMHEYVKAVELYRLRFNAMKEEYEQLSSMQVEQTEEMDEET